MVGLYCKTGLRNSSDSTVARTTVHKRRWIIRLLTTDKFLNSNEEARQYNSESCFLPTGALHNTCRATIMLVRSTIMDLEEVGLFNSKRWIEHISRILNLSKVIFNWCSVSTKRKHRCYNHYLKRKKKMKNCPIIFFLEKNFWHREMFIFSTWKMNFVVQETLLRYCYFIFTNWWI